MSSPDFVRLTATRDGDEHLLTLAVPSDLVFFEGHFAGNPMLPGVAQILALVDARAREVFPDALEGRGARRMSRLKFQATILPGEEVALALSLTAGLEPQVRFRIERIRLDGTRETATSGSLVYA